MEINIIHLPEEFIVEVKLLTCLGRYKTIEDAKKLAFEIGKDKVGWINLIGSTLSIESWVWDGKTFIEVEKEAR